MSSLAVRFPGVAYLFFVAGQAVKSGGALAMSFGIFVLYGIFAAARDGLLTKKVAMRWLSRSFAAFFAALATRLALERT